MRLDLSLPTWGSFDVRDDGTLAAQAEQAGYGVCWAAEAYGTDAPTRLAAVAARTTTLGIGSGVMQLPARSAAMTAMTAATLDALSAGRFRLGLGVSGPQVAEGWHGQPFADPLGRTREYVDVVRLALRREAVSYAGRHLRLPLPAGPGKALRLSVRPVRTGVPIYLAAVGPRNVELAGQIADGWLAIFFAPAAATALFAPLDRGLAGAGRTRTDVDVVASVPAAVGPDAAACADLARPYAALYLGGMGSREQNFYNRLAARLGFAAAAARVQELYLAGKVREAAAAVPAEFLEQTCLLGSEEQIAGRLAAFAATGVGAVAVLPLAPDLPGRLATLHAVAAAGERAGVGR